MWDFDLLLDAAFFSVTETYFLEATLDVTFANTGPLTKRLVLALPARTLRRAAAPSAASSWVHVVGRATQPERSVEGIASQTFRMTAPSKAEDPAAVQGQEEPSSSSSSTAVIAGAVAGVAVAGIAAAVVVALVLVRRRRERRERANSDSPLVAVDVSSESGAL